MSKGLQTFGHNSPGRKRRRGWRMSALLLICGLVISGCASECPPVPLLPKPVQLNPPPPELMEPEQPNLRQRLQLLFGELQPTETAPSGS